jgi:hypothetical protein
VSRIIIGELAGIRNGNDHHGRQVKAMIHNYWSQKHVADRLTSFIAGRNAIPDRPPPPSEAAFVVAAINSKNEK